MFLNEIVQAVWRAFKKWLLTYIFIRYSKNEFPDRKMKIRRHAETWGQILLNSAPSKSLCRPAGVSVVCLHRSASCTNTSITQDKLFVSLNIIFHKNCIKCLCDAQVPSDQQISGAHPEPVSLLTHVFWAWRKACALHFISSSTFRVSSDCWHWCSIPNSSILVT